MEDDFSGNQGPQWTRELEEKKKTDFVTPYKWLVSNKVYEGTIMTYSAEIKELA